ncbi:MAG: DUF4832 domain-containing protein [Marmoricola sp.]
MGAGKQSTHGTAHRQSWGAQYALDGDSGCTTARCLANPSLLLGVGHHRRSSRGASAQVSQWHISTTSSRSMRLLYANMSSAQQAAYVAAGRNAGYRYQLKSVSLPYSIRQGVTYTPAITWAQTGSAPTYDPWRVRLVLRNGLGTQVWTGESALDLRGLAVGTKTDRPQMRVSGLTPGRYQLLVEVLDPSGYSAPMHLANTGRTSSGAYPVGWLRVRQ